MGVAIRVGIKRGKWMYKGSMGATTWAWPSLRECMGFYEGSNEI